MCNLVAMRDSTNVPSTNQVPHVLPTNLVSLKPRELYSLIENRNNFCLNQSTLKRYSKLRNSSSDFVGLNYSIHANQKVLNRNVNRCASPLIYLEGFAVLYQLVFQRPLLLRAIFRLLIMNVTITSVL